MLNRSKPELQIANRGSIRHKEFLLIRDARTYSTHPTGAQIRANGPTKQETMESIQGTFET